MLKTKTCRAFLKAILLLFTIIPFAAAQSTNPAWLEELEYELVTDFDCYVVEYLSMHEGKLGGLNMFYAKVKCADGRQFDASKTELEEEFNITLCKVVAC